MELTFGSGYLEVEYFRQELNKVGGLDQGDQGGELGVEGEQVEDGARLPCASVQWNREVEGSPGYHSVGVDRDAIDIINDNTDPKVEHCGGLAEKITMIPKNPSHIALSETFITFFHTLVMSRCRT